MSHIIQGRKLRIGIVGLGRISQKHFDAIEAHNQDIELVSVCDVDKLALETRSTQYRVPGYRSLEEMLKRESLDLITLCTPSGLHPDQSVKAARSGVSVITEKPMATRWRDGLRMVRTCDQEGVRLFVVKQNRKNTTLQLLKRAVNERRFGSIYLVHINVFWNRPQEYYDSAKWRGTWELDGGALMNQASHYIDLLDWIIGPVESVQAMTGTVDRTIEVENSGVLNVRWRSGALGSLSVTMLTYPKNLEGSITVLGERGTARVGGVAANEIQQWEFADQRDYDEQVREANYKPTSVYGFGHPGYYQNVIEVMRGRAEPDTDGREGLKSLELLIAAYISARDGRTVSLPLEY